jgi:hypothetical protein
MPHGFEDMDPDGGERNAQPSEVAALVEQAGVELPPLSEGDLVSTAVVVLVVVEEDGGIRLRMGRPPSTSWIEERGILETAVDVHRMGFRLSE